MYTSTCNCECIFHVIRQARLLHHHLNVHNSICSVSLSSLLVNWKPQLSLYCELDFNKQKNTNKYLILFSNIANSFGDLANSFCDIFKWVNSDIANEIPISLNKLAISLIESVHSVIELVHKPMNQNWETSQIKGEAHLTFSRGGLPDRACVRACVCVRVRVCSSM